MNGEVGNKAIGCAYTDQNPSWNVDDLFFDDLNFVRGNVKL